MWESETAAVSEETRSAVPDFLQSVAGGRKAEWVHSYFGERYPADVSDADVIDEIYSKASHDKGRTFYQCPECGRLYVQKQIFTNEWDCFVKGNSQGLEVEET